MATNITITIHDELEVLTVFKRQSDTKIKMVINNQVVLFSYEPQQEKESDKDFEKRTILSLVNALRRVDKKVSGLPAYQALVAAIPVPTEDIDESKIT